MWKRGGGTKAHELALDGDTAVFGFPLLVTERSNETWSSPEPLDLPENLSSESIALGDRR